MGSHVVNETLAAAVTKQGASANLSSFGIVGRSTAMAAASLGTLKQEIDAHIARGVETIIVDGFKQNANYRYEESSPRAVSFEHHDFTHLPKLIEQTKRELALGHLIVTPTRSVALVHPSHSLMIDYMPQHSEVVGQVMQSFADAVSELSAHGIAFTVVDEPYLLSCKINSDGDITSPDGALFNAIVMPYSRLILNSFFVFLEKFAKKKRPILFLNAAPEGSFDDGHSPSFAQRVQKLVKSKSKQVEECQVWNLVELLTDDTPPAVSYEIVRGGGTISINELPQQIQWIVNTSGVETRTIIRAAEMKALQVLNPFNLEEMRLIPVADELAHLTLADGEMLLVKPLFDVEGELSEQEEGYRIKMREDKWSFRGDSLNAFPLSRWSSKLGVNRGRGTLTSYYDSHFIAEKEIESAYIACFTGQVAGNRDRFRISLNGTELQPLENDEIPQENLPFSLAVTTGLQLFDISTHVEKGANRLLLLSTGDNDLPDPIAYPLFVLVDGAVEQSTKGWTVLADTVDAPYRWGGAGYPYLMGIGTYTLTFEVPRKFEKVSLTFEGLSGSALVRVNDKVFDRMLWAPYRLDITEAVKSESRNKLSVNITGTSDVITRLKGDSSGLQGGVFLEIIGDSGEDIEVKE